MGELAGKGSNHLKGWKRLKSFIFPPAGVVIFKNLLSGMTIWNFLIVFKKGLELNFNDSLNNHSSRDPRLAGSNPAEVGGVFADVKILSTSPPGGTLSRGSVISGSLKNLKPEKNISLSKI